MAVRDDFKLYPGDDKTVALGYRVNGVPYDFTGASARMQVRPTPQSETLLFELDSIGGGIVLTEGVITLYFDSAQTALLTTPVSYDLELTAADASVKTLRYGIIYPLGDGEVSR